MKYILGFFATILVIMLIIILILGGGENTPNQNQVNQKPLYEYAGSTMIARLTVDGPMDASQNHIQERISVSKNEVVYQKLKGYSGEVVASRIYSNDQAAYEDFLRGLSLANYTAGDPDKAKADPAGHCPLNNRYIFELIEESKTVQSYWSTSCNKTKTFKGNTNVVLQIFKAQVGDYDQPGNPFKFALNF